MRSLMPFWVAATGTFREEAHAHQLSVRGGERFLGRGAASRVRNTRSGFCQVCLKLTTLSLSFLLGGAHRVSASPINNLSF